MPTAAEGHAQAGYPSVLIFALSSIFVILLGRVYSAPYHGRHRAFSTAILAQAIFARAGRSSTLLSSKFAQAAHNMVLSGLGPTSAGHDVQMASIIKQVLPFRSSKYLNDLWEKMIGEGIVAPADLLKVSQPALETKMSMHADLNILEMADVVSLRKCMANVGKDKGTKRDRTTSPEQRLPRSCSNKRGRGRKRANSAGKAGGRNNSRPTRGNNNQRNTSTNNNRNYKPRRIQDLFVKKYFFKNGLVHQCLTTRRIESGQSCGPLSRGTTMPQCSKYWHAVQMPKRHTRAGHL